MSAPTEVVAPPGLLRCLILSWNEVRAEGLQRAAERQAWDALVCSNSAVFIKQLFRMKVPLTIVDLPEVSAAEYSKMRMASAKVREVSDALLVVCAASAECDEEIWARELGAWAYMPEVPDPTSVDWVFEEARSALARQASASLEGGGISQPGEPLLRVDRASPNRDLLT